MWAKFLSSFLNTLISHGALVLVHPDGRTEHFGDPDAPPVTVRLHDPSVVRQLVLDGELHLGEAYTGGTLTVDDDDIYGLLDLMTANQARLNGPPSYRWLAWLRRLFRYVNQFNPADRAKRNVAHHYDLSSEFYGLFLDRERQYSCAYFHDGQTDLDQAQDDKKALIATKLLLTRDSRVLDIGCGWGGLGLYLARRHGARVTGVTLSEEQFKFANERAQAQQMKDKAKFFLQDYRAVDGKFDRVVSVGMFEHVGVPHYAAFFSKIRDCLEDDGVALLHTIGRPDGPGITNPWIAKYIFPGGYAPALSEILTAVEHSGLIVTDVEVWRLHYAETLRAWRERFEAKIERVREIYDERFCRMWRFYLVGSELAFRHAGHVVFQIQMAKRQDAVPLTRDYLAGPQDLPVVHHGHSSHAA